ncbi:MAG: cytochrome P450 [Pseudomonadota bacterium]|nr:cytochrome P450 [Pseudomonadota bacterium]
MQSHLDPVTAVTHVNPYPYYQALARQTALEWNPSMNLWIAAHPACVRAILVHPDCRVRPPHEPVPATIAGPAGNVFGALARMSDGAPHAARRAAVDRVLATWTDDIVAYHAGKVAAMLLDDGVGTAAQLNAFTLAMPVCTVASLLGFADADLPRVAQWTGQFVAGLSPLSTASQVVAAHAATQALLAALVAVNTPNVAHGAAGIDAATLQANLLGILSQTYDATAGLLGNCIVGLLRGAAPAGLVATTMHADPAIQNTRRYAAQDVTIGTATVGRGQGILLVLAAARAEYGFGHGIHRCPGQAIARIIVEQAVARIGALPRVAWRYRPSVNARVPEFIGEQA